MQVIVPSFARSIIGEQTFDPAASYRPLSYLLAEKVPEGELIYNVMTGELILAGEGEEGLSDYLVRNWFQVPQDHDDRKLALELREIARLLATQSDDTRSYTILTTTACNARCPYCFESGSARATMDKRTAEAVAGYIEREAADKKVSLRWFGGEPLCNTMPIDLVSKRLSAAGIVYNSHMVSNGYLLGRKVIERAVDLWRLQFVQITLDGTEEEYNRCKGYINAEGSPFKRVLGNIDALLDAGIRVDIRLNLGEENGGDLLELADLLGERFGGRKECRAYVATLFGLASNELEAEYWRLNQRLDEACIKKRLRLPRKMKPGQCMADSDSSVVISPTGSLSKCEHHFEPEDSCGSVFGGITNQETLSYWRMHCDEEPECAECPFFPQCVRVKGCIAHAAPCDATRRKRIFTSLSDSMLEEKNRFLTANAEMS